MPKDMMLPIRTMPIEMMIPIKIIKGFMLPNKLNTVWEIVFLMKR